MTTSPVTKPEIERVFGSLAPAPPPSTAQAEWSRYAAFLKRPTLPLARAEGGGSPAVLRLLALDMAIMLVFVGALSLASAFGFEMPENVNTSLAPTLATVALVVVAAPLGEELAFRSWLSGHPAVMAVVALVAAGFGIAALGADLSSAGTLLALVGMALVLIAAPLAAYVLRRGSTPAFFARYFAVFFWLSVVGFALIHLANYTEGTLAMLLPLILPQFALGTMLGYLRVHYGLIWAIALHAAHNAILFGLAVLGGLGAESAAGG